MADKQEPVQTVCEEIELYGGDFRVEVFGQADATFVEFGVLRYDDSLGAEAWSTIDSYELTAAELDALIDALTRARALRSDPAGGNGSAGDE